MAADQLVVDTDLLRTTASQVSRVRDTFEGAARDIDDVAAAVGHAGLANKVRGFVNNWDFRRSELVEQLETIRNNMIEVADGFESADCELGNALTDPQPSSASSGAGRVNRGMV
ncbi:hypothetical protein I6E74_05850 [Salinibacterium sp. SWN139]|uniref:hypothetical protein n=1 Tax=Salinibacterium sp. SWN139 TaxID=2792055 RepID=UPI0018CF173C|nr:hypothetical protein [Salinibacterium sp. SWN139]MBH0053694.1 hypothetical protein [Salinibacterium sp. SWN139]